MATDKSTILDILKQHLGTQVDQGKLEQVAEVIASSDLEWEEVTGYEPEFAFHLGQCQDLCYIASELKRGAQFRLLKKKNS